MAQVDERDEGWSVSAALAAYDNHVGVRALEPGGGRAPHKGTGTGSMGPCYRCTAPDEPWRAMACPPFVIVIVTARGVEPA